MTTSSSYKNGREHLADELRKLDALLHLQVLKHKELPAGKGTDPFKGLYITEEDIDAIMGPLPGEEPAAHGNSPAAVKRKNLLEHLKMRKQTLSEKIENSLNAGVHLPIFHLASIFHLDSFEWDTLLICLAPELDLKYEKFYAYLQDDVTKKQPSVNLILDLLCDHNGNNNDALAARACFFEESPLFKYQLIKFTGEMDENHNPSRPLLSRCLKMDDRIARFLLGFNGMDSRLSAFAKMVNPQKEWGSLIMEDKLKDQLMQLANSYLNQNIEKGDGQGFVFYLKGPYGAGKKSTAEAFCHHLELPLMVVDTRDLFVLSSENGFDKTVERLFRETLLQPAAVYFEGFDWLMTHDHNGKQAIYQKKIIQAVEEFSFLTFLAGENEWQPQQRFESQAFVKIDMPVPAYSLRKRLWKEEVKEIDIDGVANKFNFTPGQIRDAAAGARNLAMVRGCTNNNNGITIQDLYQSCHSQSNQKLTEMARKIYPKYTWDDIVLPLDKLRQLKEICSHVKYRQIVYSQWGFGAKFSLGKGLNILFSGPSGTGKTMSSEIISGNLGLELYKIDLSNVVSKYIGETEKNLNRIFKEAETANCILFFDEADALFGKRSEVKDSHDRYANIEIGYLLQKMEEHEGVVILATNFLKNIDDAFKRRIHFSVDFPFPDELYRLKIWQNIFPPEMPGSKDTDFEFLAKRFKLSGGNIKNIAVNAAFLAAEKSPQVDMSHAVWATRRELQKMGKHCSPSDFGKYYDLIVSMVGDQSE